MDNKTIKEIGDSLTEFVLRVSKGTLGLNAKVEEIQVLPEIAEILLKYRQAFIWAGEDLQEEIK